MDMDTNVSIILIDYDNKIQDFIQLEKVMNIIFFNYYKNEMVCVCLSFIESRQYYLTDLTENLHNAG